MNKMNVFFNSSMKVENPSYFQNLNPMLGAGKQKSRLHQVIKGMNAKSL